MKTCSPTSGWRATSSSTACSHFAAADRPAARRPAPPALTNRRHRRRPSGDRQRGPSIAADAIVAPAQYPPNGEHRRRPSERRGGRTRWRSAGRVASPERRSASCSTARRSARCRATARATSPGASSIPPGTTPGQHLLTVRGSACELNAVITVARRASDRARVHRLVEPHAHLRARRHRRGHDRRRARARIASPASPSRERAHRRVTGRAATLDE